MKNQAKLYHVDDSEIIKEAKVIAEAKKDIKAFSYLYDKYFIQIFRYIYNRVENEEIASDICSQVFLKAMQNINKYEHRGLPYASFLYRIARNEINQESRKNKIQRISSAKQSDIEHVSEEIELTNALDYTPLIKMLNQLPEKDLELIEMKYFEKRSYREISEILNIKENNLKVKLHRIIQKMKKEISQTFVLLLFLVINFIR